ncbi:MULTISPECIES: hypothetical protein [Kribbella]|uniref:Uncharacterized protein n=1 Tax=Kribbella pratensis TaxID=2512112 RepID=A0ABY2FHG0_9ACTN|nr:MULTISPECIES: hypothetical protein [Kribbella]TDW90817.1 hypothetical protein EV137_4644 [Kribbella pratensis]TDW98571.1 hypothetical protein EV647_3293 [Kribbella sp. VKM Ac-2566]
MTNAARTTKQSMTTRLAQLAAGAAISLALMTTAAPAMAQYSPEPGDVYVSPEPGDVHVGLDHPLMPTPEAAQPEPAVDVSSAALGALGAIALGGVGLGITLGIQRRRDHSTAHPA